VNFGIRTECFRYKNIVSVFSKRKREGDDPLNLKKLAVLAILVALAVLAIKKANDQPA